MCVVECHKHSIAPRRIIRGAPYCIISVQFEERVIQKDSGILIIRAEEAQREHIVTAALVGVEEAVHRRINVSPVERARHRCIEPVLGHTARALALNTPVQVVHSTAIVVDLCVTLNHVVRVKMDGPTENHGILLLRTADSSLPGAGLQFLVPGTYSLGTITGRLGLVDLRGQRLHGLQRRRRRRPLRSRLSSDHRKQHSFVEVDRKSRTHPPAPRNSRNS
nr:MAG TPA: hypothetical protein [Caudoviricetes sp.]